MRSASLAPCPPRRQCFSLKKIGGTGKGKNGKGKKKRKEEKYWRRSRGWTPYDPLISSVAIRHYHSARSRLHFASCKVIQDSLGFWILRREYRIACTVFQALSVELGFWIPKPRIIGFHEQSFSGFRNSESLRWHEPELLNHNIVIVITLFPWTTCALLFIRCLPTSDLATDTDCDTITTFRTFENVSRESGLFYFWLVSYLIVCVNFSSV